MSDDGPTSRDLHDIVQEALGRRPTLWSRLRALVARLRSRAATLGGYWGGVTMRWRSKP